MDETPATLTMSEAARHLSQLGAQGRAEKRRRMVELENEVLVLRERLAECYRIFELMGVERKGD
jgi:hypothetical protein